MADARALGKAVRAVERVAAVEQGRLLVVTPAGTRGNPNDPDRLDHARATDRGLTVSTGAGHATYALTEPTLLDADKRSVRLSARHLDVVFTAHGSSGAVDELHWDDAEVVLTWDPEVAARAHRTPGRPRAPREGTHSDPQGDTP